jgi:predicted DNA-binding transcriptional regulator YafY
MEALVLGARWVAERADPAMGQAARSAAAWIMIGGSMKPGFRR